MDGYLSVRLEALTQIIDTFGGIQVYVPQDMDYGGSHLSQGYQTMDGAAAEFFLRTRHIYADSDLGRLRMQRYFYAALFARMRSMTVWDIAKLLPVITSQMETDLSATELVSVAVSMLKISSSNIMFGQVPVYMGQAISYNGNSTVVVARQETADLLNEYFRENTGPVDASQLNIAGDDGLFDLSGLTASDPSVQFMGTLNEETSTHSRQTTLTVRPQRMFMIPQPRRRMTARTGTAPMVTAPRQNDRSCNKGELNGKQRTCHPSGPRAGREKRL